MPKISAPSLAEHRARQRAALISAARDLLLEGGYQALSFGAVAERAELARPSVYWYFKSKDDIIAAICEESLPAFLARVHEAMSHAETPRDRLAAYVRSQLEAVADGEHRLGQIVALVPLEPEVRERIAVLHEGLAAEITDAVDALGTVPGHLGAALAQGVVEAGVQRIEAGVDPELVIESAMRMVLSGLVAG
ncbi:TetR/AcrR family transcriptional regulator [Actinomadura darangshiensis]|uniref:TetR/AcrR family transcriptional regulator n=1 Tax=Actinomadura darangshiensis TaxID=705336 RepID=A0A4R5BZ18_9ACTN|nr:TetR/AcrR family transcriptional regulator [Actinomadura darangshiensis]TDD89622.1 TetR/AcrR family transcriptional regulator [Actinomadura darangshiensis]